MSGRNMLLVLVFGFAVVATAGCQQGVAREEFDALKKNNMDLRNENAQLRTDYDQAKLDAERLAAQKQAAVIEPVPTARPGSDIERLNKQPLPEGVKLVNRDGTAVLRIDGAMVNFASGKASLTPEGKQAMDRVALILNRDFPGRAIIVEGHTDSDPIVQTRNLYKSNWELGMKRSTEVVDYLMLKGVDPKRVRATSFGENQPIADNGNRSGKAKNRRVEIVVLQQDAGTTTTPTAAIPY